MNLIKANTLLLILFLIACGGTETNTTTSSTETAVEKAKKIVNESPSQLKEATETANAMAQEGLEKVANLKETIAATAPTIADADTAPIEQKVKQAKETVSVSMDDAKIKAKQVVETAKESVTTSTKKAENVVIQGAEKVKEAAKSPIPSTAPKIVEHAKEEVTSTAAAVTTAAVAATTAVKEKITAKPSIVDHSLWDQLLQKHVTTKGKVNYKAIKADPTNLDAYLKILSNNPINKQWSRNQKMAYWINAYNAFTVKMIVDNYPLKSILDLHSGKAWDHSWIQLGDKTYTLNDIEHKILRPQFKDARIHFAVNCAATSCPPILNRAWTSENLDKLLDLQTKKFINNSNFNSLGKEVAVSKIFEWYKEDFGELRAYINKYAIKSIPTGVTIQFKEYDWALNEQ